MGHKKDSSYVEDLKEWQDKQYLPGYYLGKVHFATKYMKKGPSWPAVVTGLLGVFLGLLVILNFKDLKLDILGYAVVFLSLVSILYHLFKLKR